MVKQSHGVAPGAGTYRRFGEGEPVLILSNPQANPDWWARGVVASLVDAGFEAVTFVHQGPGYEPPAVVRDVKRLLDHLKLEDVRLLGWSQGAAITQEVALAYPGSVRAAALIATYGRQNRIDQVLQESWDALSVGGEELDPVRLALGLLTSHPPALLASDEFVGPLIDAQAEWASKGSTSIQARERSVSFIRAYQERLETLSKITAPCLVIGFGQDTDTFAARAQEVAAAIPGSRYIEFPDAGHLEPVINTQKVMTLIIDFLQEH